MFLVAFAGERYLIALCSAISIALFLFFKGAIFRARGLRAALALLVLAVGTLVLPEYRAFEAAIFLTWIALAFLVYLCLAYLRRNEPVFRQIWSKLDMIAVASLIAAAVYSLARIVLRLELRPPGLTLLACLLILAACVHVVHELDRALVLQRPVGLVFGQVLLIAGVIPWCFGSQAANAVTFASIAAGAAIIAVRLKSYLAGTEERRILEKMAQEGDRLQPEYTEASPECPEPRLWSMFDPMTAEKEVLDLLYSIVRALKPRLVVETGTFSGISSTYIARALRENGRGRLITCEMDPVVHENACERFRAEGLGSTIDCRLSSSLDLQIDDEIDLLYCDSDLKVRGAEVRRFISNINPFGLILMHDAGSRFQHVRQAALEMEAEGLISVVLLSTPRGLVIAQKRDGRR